MSHTLIREQWLIISTLFLYPLLTNPDLRIWHCKWYLTIRNPDAKFFPSWKDISSHFIYSKTNFCILRQPVKHQWSSDLDFLRLARFSAVLVEFQKDDTRPYPRWHSRFHPDLYSFPLFLSPIHMWTNMDQIWIEKKRINKKHYNICPEATWRQISLKNGHITGYQKVSFGHRLHLDIEKMNTDTFCRSPITVVNFAISRSKNVVFWILPFCSKTCSQIPIFDPKILQIQKCRIQVKSPKPLALGIFHWRKSTRCSPRNIFRP